MSPGPRIVHKQFNSPIGLYSQQNIQETLSKHVHQLNNGAVGIDFNDPTTSKPANLANSSVLRMLEEEERQRRGLPKLDDTQIKAIVENLKHIDHRYDWPPPARMQRAKSCEGLLSINNCLCPETWVRQSTDKKKVVWPPALETNGYHSGASLSQGQQQQQPLSVDTADYARGPSSASPGYYQASPAQVSPRQGAGVTRLVPVSTGVQLRQPYAPSSPQPYTPPPFSSEPFHPQGYATLPARPQQHSPSTRWAPVGPPVSQVSPQHSPLYYEGGAPAPYESPVAPRYEPPPTTIELRPHPPVHQRPPPVFASQPATASFQGGVNMRGDQKWPPQSVKEAVAAENHARMELAKGPACRPRKVKKDYSGFFARHALNNNYPGYRAPPGTQHYEDHPGQTSF